MIGALPLAALAQDKWPSRAIKIIYPYPPANDMDVVTRLLAEVVSKRLGVPVQDLFKKVGIPPFPMTAEQMSKRVVEDTKWITELMTELGLAKK